MQVLRTITAATLLLWTSLSAQAEATPDTDSASTLLPFTATYRTEWKLGWFSINVDATRTLRKQPDGHWHLSFDAETGAAALRETSEFSVTNGRIQPLEYNYKASGLFNEPDRSLLFVPNLNLVKDIRNNKTYTNAWEGEVHDNLTYMLQAGLDLARGDEEIAYTVFEKNKGKEFRFKVVGEEIIDTRIGKLRTVKVEQLRNKKSREVFAWYAIDRHYQLVQLRDKENGKTRYQIDITSLEP
ncbi:DUF3108 domain-containing protein [Thalassolituus sp. LLYu03]|uniref:DUF3108 domain-containing protein n=1 Tax=Thalassolituus sp. LLYu03 TaxID=3421656 RepID=UPI003D2D6AD5